MSGYNFTTFQEFRGVAADYCLKLSAKINGIEEFGENYESGDLRALARCQRILDTLYEKEGVNEIDQERAEKVREDLDKLNSLADTVDEIEDLCNEDETQEFIGEVEQRISR